MQARQSKIENRKSKISTSYAGWVRWISIAAIVACLLLIARQLPLDRGVDLLNQGVGRLGVWGPLAFGLIYVVATVLFMPGLILSIAAGAIFGLWIGTITISLGSTVGAALAFLIARYLARRRVAEAAWKRPRFHAIDQAIREGGWKIVALLRLSPAIPFNLQNYLYGLTPIRFRPYVLASWLAMLPGTFMYVYIGHVAGLAATGEREKSVWEWVALGLGLIATLVATIYITRLARIQLRQRTAVEEAPKNAPQESDPPQAGPERSEGPGRSTPGPPDQQGWPWSASVAAILACLAVGATVFAYTNQNLLSGLFGPPDVTMKEVYEEEPGGASFDHAAFDAVVSQYVNDRGLVDYQALKRNPDRLNQYIESLADAPFDRLGRDEKLALLINAYNAFTLRLILDYYPIDSIRDIPAAKRWKAERWEIGEHVWSLDQIEHQQIRTRFREPRIHWALVCAAISCPKLRQEAYVPERIDRQLRDQAMYVHNHPRWFRYDPGSGVVHLTMYYHPQWYAGDFEQAAGSILQYAAQYSSQLQEALEAGERPEVRFIPYDWSLNSRTHRRQLPELAAPEE